MSGKNFFAGAAGALVLVWGAGHSALALSHALSPKNDFSGVGRSMESTRS